MFPILVVQSSFLLWNRKCAVTDLVTSQVNHLVCFSVSAVSSVSPVSSHVVQLFLFPTRGSAGVLLSDFFECCIECHTVLNHQPLLYLDATFVGFLRCMLSNVVTFRVYSRSKLSVGVARDDPSVSRCFFVHLLNVHVLVSRVGEVHTGQFDLSLIALVCFDDHPSADVLDLNELSLVCQLCDFERSHQRPYRHICKYIFFISTLRFPNHFFSCLQVSHKRTASHLHPSSSLRSSSNRSPLFKHLSFFLYNVKGYLRVMFLPFFLFCCC